MIDCLVGRKITFSRHVITGHLWCGGKTKARGSKTGWHTVIFLLTAGKLRNMSGGYIKSKHYIKWDT